MPNPERRSTNLREHVKWASISSIGVAAALGGIALIEHGKVLSGVFAYLAGLSFNGSMFFYGLGQKRH